MSSSTRKDQYSEVEWALVSSFIEDAQSEIRSDGDSASEPAKRFFAYVADNLTDSGLTIGTARTAARLSSNYAAKVFSVVNIHPKDYIDWHRIRLAQRILQYTKVYIYRVAFTVGFEDQSSFSRTYGRLIGHPPKSEPTFRWPDDAPRVADSVAEIDIEVSGTIALERTWQAMRQSSRDDFIAYLLAMGTNIDISLFHFLLSKAKYEGRFDRKMGVAITIAALDALQVVELRTGKIYLDERTLGYANLSNACRMCFDMEGALEASLTADRLLPFDSCEKPKLYAQVKFFKAYLLWWQRRIEAALDLIDEILPLIRKNGPTELLVRTLLLCSEIYDSTGRPERAMPLYFEAGEFTPILDDGYIIFATHFNLALVSARLSMAEGAAVRCKVVREKWHNVRDQVPESYLWYLEALTSRLTGRAEKAEYLFLAAMECFNREGLEIFSALVALDLSLLYFDLERNDEAFKTATSIIPLISRYTHCEAISALTVLQELKRRKAVDSTLLKKALNHLDLARKDPTINLLPQN